MQDGPYKGTDLFNLVELIESATVFDKPVVFDVGRAALKVHRDWPRIIVVPLPSPGIERQTLSGPGIEIQPVDCYICTTTELDLQNLTRAYRKAAVLARVREQDLGQERPWTEEDERAGLTKRGPVRIVRMTFRFCPGEENTDGVPLVAVGIDAGSVGPQMTEESPIEVLEHAMVEEIEFPLPT